jgi:glycosyltransferase involved in cell wall biosynthesis
MIIGIDASRAVSTQRTGTEAYAYFLLDALLPIATAKGHSIRLYFNQAPPAELFPNNDQVKNVIMPFARLWTHVRLALELRRNPPDVFFTPAHVIPFLYRGASVATIHDLGFHYFPEAHTRRRLIDLKWSTYCNGRISHHIVADSQATKADLIRFYDIDPDKITVIYPGIDPTLQPVHDEDLVTAVQQKYGITPPYMLYIGTLQPRKNLQRLIHAYAASGINHQLVLAGKKGWLSEPILQSIQTLPLEIAKRIILPGFVAESDKAALISGATALLFPSLYEGFGFPVLEGQVCDTAVLTANSSSLPEVAGDGALLIDPLDQNAITVGIQRLATDKQLRAQLINAGRINNGRFNWPQAATQTLSILEQTNQPLIANTPSDTISM